MGPNGLTDPADVQLWTVPLDPPVPAKLETLSDDELSRSDRFRFDVHRHRYIVARRALRHVLAGVLGADPAALEFEYSRFGKPSLRGADVRFNVSHSAGVALIAVSFGRELGVDIEQLRPNDDLLPIAGRFFAPAERDAVAAATSDERVAMFFRIWTRKEAYLKASGDGLNLPLDSFTVPTGPDPVQSLLSSARGAAEVARWRYCPIPAPDGFAASLLVEAGQVQLRVHPSLSLP